LADAALELKDAIAKFDRQFGRIYRTRYVASNSIDQILKDILRWHSKKPRLQVDIDQVRKKRGRPRGHCAWRTAVSPVFRAGRISARHARTASRTRPPTKRN
jgi:hypothetical protein